MSSGLWKYRGGDKGASNSPGQAGAVGIEGGWPSARFAPATWTSYSGLLFLFGGGYSGKYLFKTRFFLST